MSGECPYGPLAGQRLLTPRNSVRFRYGTLKHLSPMKTKKIKFLRKQIMGLFVFLTMPFIVIFCLIICFVAKEWAVKIINWIYDLLDFSFLGGKLNPPPNPYPGSFGCNLYGLQGTLTEYGNGLIREISKNNLSFYVGYKNNEFACFICSSDGSNLPYRHLLMKIIRDEKDYPISIHTITGKIYGGIKNDYSLRIAVKEIIQSNETKSIIEAMTFVFWGRYDKATIQNRDALISIHGLKFVEKYEQLIKLRNQNLLILDNEREELITMHQQIFPDFGAEIGESGLSDINRLSVLSLPARRIPC